ncbi:hypothetical protein IWX46DRAFT_106456 [Phyllosticta citricarpa]|uniref:Uncharacterized protein n=1 Tax=Phyllosticta citricarpa TaxID=55181 RepID=A0ABR1MCB1_9PEZI
MRRGPPSATRPHPLPGLRASTTPPTHPFLPTLDDAPVHGTAPPTRASERGLSRCPILMLLDFSFPLSFSRSPCPSVAVGLTTGTAFTKHGLPIDHSWSWLAAAPWMLDPESRRTVIRLGLWGWREGVCSRCLPTAVLRITLNAQRHRCHVPELPPCHHRILQLLRCIAPRCDHARRKQKKNRCFVCFAVGHECEGKHLACFAKTPSW